MKQPIVCPDSKRLNIFKKRTELFEKLKISNLCLAVNNFTYTSQFCEWAHLQNIVCV